MHKTFYSEAAALPSTECTPAPLADQAARNLAGQKHAQEFIRLLPAILGDGGELERTAAAVFGCRDQDYRQGFFRAIQRRLEGRK